jgi:hypothetical protein
MAEIHSQQRNELVAVCGMHVCACAIAKVPRLVSPWDITFFENPILQAEVAFGPTILVYKL